MGNDCRCFCDLGRIVYICHRDTNGFYKKIIKLIYNMDGYPFVER